MMQSILHIFSALSFHAEMYHFHSDSSQTEYLY